MKNKLMRAGCLLILCLTLAMGTGVTALAFVDESAAADAAGNAEGKPADTVAAKADEKTAGSTAAKQEDNAAESTDETAEINRSVLTPEGNMNLVDDVAEEEAKELQFMTVNTRSGKTFYLIIERTKNSENVHFLNQVDEADLMELMSDKEKEQFVKDNTPEETEAVVKPEVDTEETEETGPAAEKPQKKTGNTGLVMLAVVGVIGAAVAGAFYFLKRKPGGEASLFDEDLEFYDDEDYETEEETEEDEEESSEDNDDAVLDEDDASDMDE